MPARPWEIGLAETHQTLVTEPAAQPHRRAGRRRPAHRPRRGDRRAARRRRVRLLDRAADRGRLRDDAGVPPEHLPGRRRDAGPGAAQALRRPAGARHQLLLLRRRGSARGHGRARLSHDSTRWSGRCRCSTSASWSSTGRRRASTSRALFTKPEMPASVGIFHSEPQNHHLEKVLDRKLIAAGAGRDRSRRAGEDRGDDQEHRPHRRRDALRRDRQALRPHGTSRRHDPREAQRHGRTKLRRMACARHHLRAGGRSQRLCRQGPLGRAASSSIRRTSDQHRAGGVDHRRQHSAVRRDRGRRLFPRHRAASASRCAIPAPSRSWKARATIAANT